MSIHHCMEKTPTAKLDRQAWVILGLQTLVAKGIDAVRIEPLAKQLKVTRGSFYWHFKNHEELLVAMLQEWKIINTQQIIEEVEAIGPNPNQKLQSLFEIAAQDDNHLEKAMRVWAANDDRAAAAIADIDLQRLEYLESLFRQLGFAAMEAQVRARVAYSFRLGWFVMPSAPEPVDSPKERLSQRLTEIRLVHKIITQTDDVMALNNHHQ
jgi:AcrR family transcriptional regulator